ncbi:MAG: hypothetical protein LBF34_00470 [Puniceicoccales bacterium]|nr:hypothetical protein [Puniceicoccales bacterium]
MYEPYEYTNHRHNQGQYAYPGAIAEKYWDRAALEAYIQAANDFQRRHKILSNRILVGEFGCHRTQKGLSQYFADLIAIFTANN